MQRRRITFVETRAVNGIEPLVRLAKKQGFEIILISRDPTLYFLNDRESKHDFYRYCKLQLVSDTTNVKVLMDEAPEVLATSDAVLTFSDAAAPVVAKLCERLQLRQAEPGAVLCARDKFAWAQVLRKASLPHPRFHLVRSEAEAEWAFADLGQSAVMKPLAGYDSNGVTVVRDVSSARRAFRQVASMVELAGSESGAVLTQELLSGPTVSVEVLSSGGVHRKLGIMSRFDFVPPHFTERGGVFPNDHLNAANYPVVDQVLDALGLTDTAIHMELVQTSSGPVPVDIGPRLAGFYVIEAVEAATGVDVYNALCCLHLGLTIDVERIRQEHAALAAIFSPENKNFGNLCAGDSLPDSVVNRWFVGAERAALGIDFDMKGDNSDRLGALLAVGSTSEQAATIAISAAQQSEPWAWRSFLNAARQSGRADAASER